MDTHLVVYIHCAAIDIRNSYAFERAAEFTRYPCTIEIQCEDGRALHLECTPDGAQCWGWRYFRAEWEKKHGQIK